MQTRYLELYSYTNKHKINLNQFCHNQDMDHLFHLPLSQIAYAEFLEMRQDLEGIEFSNEHDTWTYEWSNNGFSSSKLYKAIHPKEDCPHVFSHIWKSAV